MGTKVSTEVYPFGVTAPPIMADYLQWENSNERIGFKWDEIRTEKTPHYTFKDKADFQRYQKENPTEFVQMEYIDESTDEGLAAMRAAVTFPGTIPAADGTPVAWEGKPEGADKLGLGSGVDVWPLPERGIFLKARLQSIPSRRIWASRQFTPTTSRVSSARPFTRDGV